MTCEDTRDRFSELVDGVLEPEERRVLEAHLGGCADCRREHERFRSAVALLRGIEPAHAPAGLVDRVLAAARPASRWRRLARAIVFPLPIKLPLELAAIVLVGVIVTLVYRGTPELEQAARVDRTTGPRVVAEPRALRAQPAPAEAPSQPRPAAPARTALGKSASPASAAELPDMGEGKDERAAETTAPPDVAGRLAATAGDAERAILELVERAGGARRSRRIEVDGVVVDVVVPRAAWPRLRAELTRLGRWQPTREPSDLPSTVHVTVLITD